jgi:hypothetical protein
VAGTLVFIPAWNEERSLPGVLAEWLRGRFASEIVSRTRSDRAATA